MAWTSHDQFFGWVHSFKLNRNNYALGGRFGTNDRPYPVILNQPTYLQVLSNWNYADTGLLVAFFTAGLLLSRRWALRDVLSDTIIERRADFKRYHRLLTFFGFSMALRNSCYRLEGYVPNGLPKQNHEMVKYDFTSEIINSTFWKYIFETHDKPSSA